MSKPLVIVESPAKARTIARFLGDGFMVESSVGHIRDLPRDPADIPPAYKSESWARLGVDVDNSFKPLYVVVKEKRQVVATLRRKLKEASELYLATDEDREGESIAWHLLEVLSPPARLPVKRMVFHEITASAIREAVASPRDLDRRLVDAQEARRILDRLYGFEVSPVLWKKVAPRLSAGRVQSVATRMVVDRERARMAFRSASYADVEAVLGPAGQPDGGETFAAHLVGVDGARVASGRDFDSLGRQKVEAIRRLDLAEAEALAGAMASAAFTVASVEEKPYKRSPSAPFATGTLQQEAGRKLRFSAARAMSVAQRLYEGGYITYMRTDSTALSETALKAARSQAAELYGSDHVAASPRVYARKVRNAQEAHEAIRPAGETFRKPESVRAEVGADEAALYDLIWKRTVASQMADARGRSLQVRIAASLEGADLPGRDLELAAGGKTIDFAGFLRAYVEGSDDPDAVLEDREVRLPALAVGDRLAAREVNARDHTTQPPARYTEASLVKALEEHGVGRPSTYASILGTIQDRGYVWKKGTALVPSFVAFAVVGLLERHFTELVDYEFTARMEDELDHIAAGEQEALPWLSKFYFGNGEVGLRTMVGERLDEIDAREINSIQLGTDDEGREVVVRVGRYGPYLQRGDDKASLADEIAPDELTIARATEILAAPSADRELGADPETGLNVFVRAGRFGPYVQLGEADPKAKDKPRTASLFKDMDPARISLDQALRLLKIPRVVGVDPSDSGEITALNGRYGPYIKKGTESRSLASEEEIFTVTLDQALALLAEPRRGRGRGAAAPPLRELGEDPVSGSPVVVRDGRFGPYVTDGTANASLRKGDSVAEITLERAGELLAERRAKAPTKRPAKRPAKKAATKKAPAKKAPAKKAPAKKAGARKAGAKKSAPES